MTPDSKPIPQAGWKHTLNPERFMFGGIFGWYEDGQLWSGIVEEIGPCSVKVRDVLPGKLASTKST